MGNVRRFAVAAAATLGMLGSSTIAHAQAPGRDTDVACTYEAEWHLSPGLLLTPTSGRVEFTGTGECEGTVKGHTVTGPISFTGTGSYAGTCIENSGKIHTKVSVPFTEGVPVFNHHTRAHTVGGVTSFMGKGEGNVTVTGNAVNFAMPPPAAQDCVAQPLVHSIQVGEIQATSDG